MSVRYAVIFEQAPNNWAAYVPDLPGCITTGATLEDTERNIREAIEGHRETLRDFGAGAPSDYGRPGRGDSVGSLILRKIGVLALRDSPGFRCLPNSRSAICMDMKLG